MGNPAVCQVHACVATLRDRVAAGVPRFRCALECSALARRAAGAHGYPHTAHAGRLGASTAVVVVIVVLALASGKADSRSRGAVAERAAGPGAANFNEMPRRGIAIQPRVGSTSVEPTLGLDSVRPQPCQGCGNSTLEVPGWPLRGDSGLEAKTPSASEEESGPRWKMIR